MDIFSGKPYARKILSSLQAYCARQEHCIYDVTQRMSTSQLSEYDKESIIQSLIDDKFIDETRYARAFIRDKIRLNHWGKIKVAYQLKAKNISSSIINPILDEIDKKEYEEILLEETKKQIARKKITGSFEDKAKVARALQSKGFEADLIFPAIENCL